MSKGWLGFCPPCAEGLVHWGALGRCRGRVVVGFTSGDAAALEAPGFVCLCHTLLPDAPTHLLFLCALLPHVLSTAFSSRKEERLLFQNFSKNPSTVWFALFLSFSSPVLSFSLFFSLFHSFPSIFLLYFFPLLSFPFFLSSGCPGHGTELQHVPQSP